MGVRGWVSATFLWGICFVHSVQGAQRPNLETYLNRLDELMQEQDGLFYADALDELLRIPTIELRETVIKKMAQVLSLKSPSVEEGMQIEQVISVSLEALRSLGSDQDVEMLSELSRWTSLTLKDQQLEQEILQVALELKNKNQRSLVSIYKIANATSSAAQIKAEAENKRNFEWSVQKARSLIDAMREKVIEQEEVLEAFQALYMQDLIIGGQRRKPEVFYLMGLPGTGKDTLVKAYLQAIWNKSDAHKDHMFRMTIKSKQEAWSYFGSGKGYIGSNELPAFLRFLVQHSGGKYLLKVEKDAADRSITFIEKNPSWDGRYTGTTPDRAIVFVNEAHNIPKEIKDNLLKEAVGDGIFPVTNPGPTPMAVDHLELPITFVFASNEGISLIEPREKNGARIGAPLSYAQLMQNYERVFSDKEALKQAQIDHYGEKNDRVDPASPGVSEEFLSRIPNSRLFLLKPISPEGLKKIARILERELSQIYSSASQFGPFHLELTEELNDFITTYQLVPSDGARPIEDRLRSFVFDEFSKAFVQGRIRPTGKKISLRLGIKNYRNGAHSLVFEVFEGLSPQEIQMQQPTYQFTRLLRPTLNHLEQQPLTDAEVQRFLSLKEEISSNVFGVDHIVERLVEAVIASESEARNRESSRGATVMAFLGKTSTGKTETARQYVMARYGRDQLPTVIDFNGIRDLQAMKAKILGTVDSRNNPIPSDFMKAYDRANGRIAFIFDESANAPKELLKGLYEILRESIVTGFSDGKPRSMRNVSIILTGNAGEEIYQSIPPELSTRRQSQAMEEVFRIFLKNEALQNKILTQTFPEALLARIGRNIFHFGPLTHKTKRQIAQLKLLQGLQRLSPKPSERGWQIQFASESDLMELFQMMEVEGYSQSYQGASIDKFVKEALVDSIKAKLLAAGVPNASEVVLSVGEFVEPEDPTSPPYRILTLTTEMGREIEVTVNLQRWIKELPQSEDQRLLVAYHEVGHEIVSHYYFHEFIKPSLLKILPGVTLIDNELVAFEGLRGGMQNQKIDTNKELVLRRASVLAGGYMAEQVVTLGHRHGAGKSNDIKRATDLIHNAILRWGLSEEWEKQAIPANLSTSDYISKHLSEREKERLHTITQRWLQEAEEMALRAIVSNVTGAFYSLTQLLAEKGELDGEEIEQVYRQQQSVFNAIDDESFDFRPWESYQRLKSVIEPHRSLIQQHTANEVLETPRFFERLFNKISQMNSSWWMRWTGRTQQWSQLMPQEKMMVKIILSGLIQDKSLQPRLSDPLWRFQLIIDPEEMLKQKEEVQKAGVIDLEKFKFYKDSSDDRAGSHVSDQDHCLTLITRVS